jgi:hypothetical protein
LGTAAIADGFELTIAGGAAIHGSVGSNSLPFCDELNESGRRLA